MIDGQTTGKSPGSLWRLVTRRNVSLVSMNTSGSSPIIYCVHPIAGDVSCFTALAEHLNGRQRVFGIQVPLSRMNAAHAASIESIAKTYVDDIVEAHPKAPVVLAGWSAGAVIALEMAQQFRNLNREVPLLVSFDGAPCNTLPSHRFQRLRNLAPIVANLPRWTKHQIFGRSYATVSNRAISELKAKLSRKRLKSAQTLDGGAAQRVLAKGGWTESQRDFITTLYSALSAYIPKRYPGNVLVFESRVQPLLHHCHVGSAWDVIAEHVEVVALNGSHETMLTIKNIAEVADTLLNRLNGSEPKVQVRASKSKFDEIGGVYPPCAT